MPDNDLEAAAIALTSKIPELIREHGTDKALSIVGAAGKISQFIASFDREEFTHAVKLIISTAPKEMIDQLKEELQ
jgi:hypothetical protein